MWVGGREGVQEVFVLDYEAIRIEVCNLVHILLSSLV